VILGEGFGIFLRSPVGPGRVCNNIYFYRNVAEHSKAKIFLGLLSSHLFGFIKQCDFFSKEQKTQGRFTLVIYGH